MPELHIEYFSTGALRPYPRNARTHSRKQIRQIADSIERFGFTNPILIDKESMVLAGHGRLAAAQFLGLTQVPCVRLEHMTPAQKRAYVLADNKLALNAGWDDQILAEELEALLDLDADFDISITGFSIAEVDSLIEAKAVEEDGDPRMTFYPPPALPLQARRHLALGPHRLICGNAWSRPWWTCSWMAQERGWCSQIRPITFRSRVMSPVWARSDTGSSPCLG